MPAAFSIPLTGLAASDPVPGLNYIEVNFAQGPASIGSNTYPIILIGNKTTAGSATADTVVYGGPNSPVPLQTTQDFINLFGVGSELHRMAKRVLAINTQTPLYAIAVTESVGVAATLAVTFVTTAAANATCRLYMGDDFVDTSITSGDLIGAIATNVAANINAKTDWAVTASATLGVVTVTAKQKGLRGNQLRGSCVITGTGVATTVTPTAQTSFTGGTTADSNVAALATLNPFRYYYMVSAAEDATQFGAVATQVATQAGPLVGIRQRAIAGSIDTSGNVTTIATGVNAARAAIVWMQNADLTPAELAANMAAVIALKEAPLSGIATNFDSFGNDASSQALWKVPAPRSGTAPSRATIKSALNNGISPIGVNANGSTYLVSMITTRSLSGAQPDFRTRDWHKVTVMDRYADDLGNKFSLQFAGKKIADDPAVGQRLPGPTVVTPRIVLAAINKLTDDYDNLDCLQNAAQIKANTQSIREASPTTRISNRIPLQPIDVLHQLASALDQTA